MLYFFIGTKAELIKMAPVMREAAQRGISYRYIDSGQHPEGSRKLLELLEVKAPDVSLNGGKDLSTLPALAGWFMKLLATLVFRPGWIRRELFPEPGVCLIHGDTVTTLLGALFARRVGCRVGHVEAGLRSWKILQPFPEELVRVICMRLCHMLFVPNKVAMENLAKMKVKAERVQLSANTVLDTLRMAPDELPDLPNIPERFGLVSLHRAESIYSRKRIHWIIDALGVLSQHTPLFFAVHKPTENRLRQYGLWERLQQMEGLHIIPHQSFFGFIALEKRAEFIVADGGSIQEESHFLGIPLLVFRNVTERAEGLGDNVVMASFNMDTVKEFLIEYAEKRSKENPYQQAAPSKEILDYLLVHHPEITAN